VGLRQFNERVVLALRTTAAWPRPRWRGHGLTAQTIGLITARLDEDQLLRREACVAAWASPRCRSA
jgi:hypothetical protein